ncbi:MAG: type II toxin-antitoxin system Phd/YefM family antitoxin [Sphingomicrobium sp.]|nr:type II toxin-antitoxin system prevent-host-death family antitoxin [Sphingomonadales bacterium]
MAMHVNIGEAKTRLSQLVAAALRGEDVVIARDGKPQAKLVPVSSAEEEERQRVIAKRKKFLGKFAKEFEGIDTGPEAIRALREYSPERRKLYGMDD